MTEETLFEQARLLSVHERVAFLDRECPDPALRVRVEALLAADAAARSPLDAGMVGDPPGTRSLIDPNQTGAHIPSPGESQGEVEGTQIAGRYTLVEPIGEGGMGRVWRAKQTEPVKRFVAVKLIKAGMDSRQVLTRFEAERQALALMDHPHIARVLDGGIHDGRPFFVMELVKGVPITEYCDTNQLNPPQRLGLFVQACQAIQHAHQKGIIHRDIKPSNVLVALCDDRPVVKVIDFGVAKATGGTLTEGTLDTGFGGVVGTPQYMSPEQATFNNLDIDTRSDVYALGVLLYELLTGSPPFSGEELRKRGLLEILRVVREEDPPRPSSKLSTAEGLPSLSASRGTEPKKLMGLLRNELDWIVMKALEKDRTRRYETANGFAADVLRYLAGEAVQAHPPSRAYRLRKFLRRNKGRVLAASLIVMASLVGIAGVVAVQVQANRDLAEKNAELEVAREQAEERFQEAREAVDQFYTEVSENPRLLAREPGTQELRKTLLLKAKAYYEKFAIERADDPSLKLETAKAFYRLANITNDMAVGKESEELYRTTIERYRALIEEDPTNERLKTSLAEMHLQHGFALYMLGRSRDARETLESGLRVVEELIKTPEDRTRHRGILAGTYNYLGLVARQEGKANEAVDWLTRALAIDDNVSNLGNMAVMLRDLSRFDESNRYLEKCLEKTRESMKAYPNNAGTQAQLARTHIMLATNYRLIRNISKAAEHSRVGVNGFERLFRSNPGVIDYAKSYLGALNNLASNELDQGQTAQAATTCAQAVTLAEEITRRHGADLLVNQRLGHLWFNQAYVALSLHQADEKILPALDRSEEAYQRALRMAPMVSETPHGISAVFHLRGDCALRRGQPAEAAAHYASAVTWGKKARELSPRDQHIVDTLAERYAARARAKAMLGQRAEMKADLDQAVTLNVSHTIDIYLGWMIQLKVLPPKGTSPGEFCYQTALEMMEYARLAPRNSPLARGYLEAAMEALRLAKKHAFTDIHRLKTDQALDPLRGRDDFKKLLAELQAKPATKP
ncbi:MAG: protein kinase [Gemmataceae bacterium]